MNFRTLYRCVTLLCLFSFQLLMVFGLCRLGVAESERHKTYNVLKFNLPSEMGPENEFGRRFYTGWLLREWRNERRTFVLFNLTGNPKTDNTIFKTVDSATQQLVLQNDTTLVIKVHYCNRSTYGQFVQLINIMRSETQNQYGWWGDDFYVWEGRQWITDSLNTTSKHDAMYGVE